MPLSKVHKLHIIQHHAIIPTHLHAALRNTPMLPDAESLCLCASLQLWD